MTSMPRQETEKDAAAEDELTSAGIGVRRAMYFAKRLEVLEYSVRFSFRLFLCLILAIHEHSISVSSVIFCFGVRQRKII